MTPRPTTTTTTPPKRPAADQSIDQILANALALGQQMAGTGTGTGGADDDPPVYVGGMPFRLNPRAPDPEARKTGNPTPVKPASQANLDFYRMPRPELLAMQQTMFAAGLYGNTRESEVPWGSYDDKTFAIWQDFVAQSARFYAVGQKRTPGSLLDEYASAVTGGQAGGTARQGRVGGGNILSVQLTNPATMRKIADSVATEVLGRKLDQKELDRVLARVHGEETTNQLRPQQAAEASNRQQFDAANAAADSTQGGTTDTYVAPTTVTTFDTNPAALAEDQLRRDKPVEAGAHDLANTYASFLDLVSKGR